MQSRDGWSFKLLTGFGSVFISALILSACSAPKPAKPAAIHPTTMQFTVTAHSQMPFDPHDAQQQLPVLVRLDIYQLDLPLGAVSGNDELWKRVDENALGSGAATADLLYKNGLRSGIASRTTGHTSRNSWIASQAGCASRRLTAFKRRRRRLKSTSRSIAKMCFILIRQIIFRAHL